MNILSALLGDFFGGEVLCEVRRGSSLGPCLQFVCVCVCVCVCVSVCLSVCLSGFLCVTE